MITGELDKDKVLILDPREASQIYNKGYFGAPLSGGMLDLMIIEAIYLADVGRIVVYERGKKADMLKMTRLAGQLYENFEILYIVYRDLRQRGYVVKIAQPPLDFRVYPRGGAPNKTPTKYWVSAISERAVFDLAELSQTVGKTIGAKKQLLLGVVDEESDLTYYKVRIVKPKGRIKPKKMPHLGDAYFIEDRVIITDPDVAAALQEREFYGKLLGESLQLSLLEAAYLYERGSIQIRNSKSGRKMPLDKYLKRARKIQPDLDLRMEIYKQMKSQGLIVKTGFKYGSHFRAYEGDPETHHAKYLIHAVPEDFTSMWPEISRAVRLAHGVKKEILLGRMKKDGAQYIRLKRYRP